MSRTRTVRLDLSTTLYETLEEVAVERDIGVPDVIRHLIVGWVDGNDAGRGGTDDAAGGTVEVP